MSSENYEKLRLQIRGVEGRVARIEEHLGIVPPLPPVAPLVAGAELRPPREIDSTRNPSKPVVTKQTTGVAHTMTVRRVGGPVVTRAAAPAAPAAVVPSSAGPQAGGSSAEKFLGVLEQLTDILGALRPPEPGAAAPEAPPAPPAPPEAGELDWLEQEPEPGAAAVEPQG